MQGHAVVAVRLAAKPPEILEHAVDDLLAARFAARRGLGQDGDEIARLLRGFAPAGGGRCDEKLLELAAALPQRGLIGCNLGETAADVRGPLLRQAAVFVERYGFVGHGSLPRW